MNEEKIRRDERRRLSMLISEHADAIGAYAVDSVAAVSLTALLIGLNVSAADPHNTEGTRDSS